MNNQKHWETVYLNNDKVDMGWYEALPMASLKLIKQCKLESYSEIIEVGCGESLLIDELLNMGYHNIVAVDISETALSKLRIRLGSDKSDMVTFLVADVANPNSNLSNHTNALLWHDRDVLHFLTEKEQQNNYFNLLKKLIAKGGYVIISVFSLDGVKECSNLPIKQYSKAMIQEKLGGEFKLLDSFNHISKTPGGEPRSHIHTLFQRT